MNGPLPDSVTVAAPAKVNLSLLAGPVRSDGYHEISSLMLPVTLGDVVTARRASGGGLKVRCAVSPGEDNLATRAVRELERRLERSFDAEIEIEKRIPAQAGLGGGSSDAAAALTAIERLFGLDLSPRLRYEIAGAVGADVPFFLWTGPQLSMGRGTVLRAVELPEPLHIVVAVPDLALSTATVYRWRDEDVPPDRAAFVERAQVLMAGVQAAARPRDLVPLVTNDLEASVVARHPEVEALKRRLLDAGAWVAAMSGSGSSVFGLYADEGRALGALRALSPAPAWYVTDLQPRETQRPRRRAPR